ncbi:hypothetical protein PLICRDRAFT_179489 [Plicaturopsis crispa FD-325 SS-3]|uniref:Uncharacterized protein n=1 Tax=Plicaturopsis crispa FD-325 SS-3 TaxID=944288 RepID=A0A0C9SRI2_PLICR|nr:hypothetical protein PLICRDRAFT_179489 [Plicaturopsis crispa FD-325 SS-3]
MPIYPAHLHTDNGPTHRYIRPPAPPTCRQPMSARASATHAPMHASAVPTPASASATAAALTDANPPAPTARPHMRPPARIGVRTASACVRTRFCDVVGALRKGGVPADILFGGGCARPRVSSDHAHTCIGTHRRIYGTHRLAHLQSTRALAHRHRHPHAPHVYHWR